MKKYFIILTTFIFSATFASAFREEWSAATNDVQISLSLNGSQQIKTNMPVIVSLKIWNASTNETSYFYYWGGADVSFSYKIISPSGKRPPRNKKTIFAGFAVGPYPIRPGEIKEFKINLSRLYRFDEVGIYKIIASTTMSRTTGSSTKHKTFEEERSFKIVSNPLNITVAVQ